MREKIKEIKTEIEAFSAKSAEELEQFRIKYLSKKGKLSSLFDDFKQIANEERKEVGSLLNDLKNAAQEKINNLKQKFEASQSTVDNDTDPEFLDAAEIGSRHPLSITRAKIVEIFCA